MYRTALVSCVVLFGSAVSVPAAVFYDFNSPLYTATGIAGQNGWTAGLGASVVVVSAPDQALLVSADDSATHSLVGSGFGNVTTVSFLSAVSNGSNAYAEMQLFDSNAVAYARIGFQNSNDHYYLYDNNGIIFVDTNPVAADNVYAVDVTLNFRAQQYRVTFTDTNTAKVTADSGFVNFVAATTSALGEAGQITLYGGTTGQSGFFDDLSISAVPEPTSALLMSLGTLGFAMARRRKSSGK